MIRLWRCSPEFTGVVRPEAITVVFMRIGHFFAALALLFDAVAVQADPEGNMWLWPVEGRATGEGIIYKPQTYIGGELDFDALYITAPHGSSVVAPTDATVSSVGWNYATSITSSIGGGEIDPDADFDAMAKDMAEEIGRGCDPKYVNHFIGLRLADGRTVYISGLCIGRRFKTGEKVSRGERIGSVHYSYRLIEEPSIELRVSSPRGTPDDPMTPFGLKTSFIPIQAQEPVTELTAEEAKEDFDVLIDAFEECYPSLDDLVADEELESYRRRVTDGFSGTVPIEDFYLLMQRTAGLLHDSHIYLYPLEGRHDDFVYADVLIGYVSGGMCVTGATEGFEQYLTRKVTAVDGIPSDSLLRKAVKFARGYDAASEDCVRSSLYNFSNYYRRFFESASPDGGYTLTFDDGSTLEAKGHVYRGGPLKISPDGSKYMMTNKYADGNCSFRMINDTTAYIGIGTFQLNETEVDEIRDFIAEHSAVPYMIVDVRNNDGGHDWALRRILSYLSDEPYAATEGYSKVMKRGRFASFAHARNYTADDEIFGDEYREVEGREGLYAFGEAKALMPDSAVHYGGRLYVLADERSCSAATLLPAMVMRSHRGVIVGRETRTAYHYMTALKFADICLPNSRITWRIPLVKCVFDTTENPRIPYGRGVIPDCYVPFTFDEFAGEKGDAILDRALKMIADGEYLGENPFEDDAKDGCAVPAWGWWTAAAVALILLLVTLRRGKNGR